MKNPNDHKGCDHCSCTNWKEELTPEQYKILREKGTEHPFTSKYNDYHGKGVFKCAACGQELFSSDAKFDSGSGWPSFYKPISSDRVTEHEDDSHGMHRIEVLCSHCKGHLGHLFDDGPEPTGLRYCINGVALELEEK